MVAADESRPTAPAVLDLRPRADFAAGHLPRACSLPLEEAPDWPQDGRPDATLLADLLPSPLLPPRHETLVVVASRAATAQWVCAGLAGRGRSGLIPVSLGRDALPEWRRRAVARGEGRPRLWRPAPFVERWAHHLPPPVHGPVADLACGSGRSAVWLALRGWRVVGVDRDPQALELTRRLAATEGVTVELHRGDLRRRDDLPAGPWSAVVMMRYLQRDLVARLPELLVPGGLVLLRTFRDAIGFAGPPRARHRLRPGELRRLLPTDRWDVLVLEESFDPDGRPAAGVVARRR